MSTKSNVSVIDTGKKVSDGEREYQVVLLDGTKFAVLDEDIIKDTFAEVEALFTRRAEAKATRERAKRRKLPVPVSVLLNEHVSEGGTIRVEHGEIKGLSVDGRRALGTPNVTRDRNTVLSRLSDEEVRELQALDKAAREAFRARMKWIEHRRLGRDVYGNVKDLAELVEEGKPVRFKDGRVYKPVREASE